MPDPWCQKRKQFPRNPIIDTFPRHIRGPRTCRPQRKEKFLITKPTLWQDIVNEDKEIETYIKRDKKKNIPKFFNATIYAKRNVYPKLIPAFEKMCRVALRRGVISESFRFFDFIDGLAEILYNRNPAHPERSDNWLSIHQVFQNEARPWYPFSWFLTLDEAATIIEAQVRGMLTRRKINLAELKEERRKVLERAEKQRKCFVALKGDITSIYVKEF